MNILTYSTYHVNPAIKMKAVRDAMTHMIKQLGLKKNLMKIVLIVMSQLLMKIVQNVMIHKARTIAVCVMIPKNGSLLIIQIQAGHLISTIKSYIVMNAMAQTVHLKN